MTLDDITTDDTSAAPVRRHLIAGLYNLRDTGGYRAPDGATRWGKLFRSDALHLIGEAGGARLTELGITQVIDLRGEDERTTSPSALDGVAVTVHTLPIFDDAAPADQAASRFDLASVYDHMIDERGAQLAAAVRIIADAADEEAVLVHCTAGKDRTGLVVALALSAAGVDRDDVVADYSETSDNLRGEWADRMLQTIAVSGVDLTPDVVELITASPAPVMRALLDRIDREYGSVAAYLTAQGLTPEELHRLTTVLIDRRNAGEK